MSDKETVQLLNNISVKYKYIMTDEEIEALSIAVEEISAKNEILNLYYGMSDSMQKAVKDVMSVTQKVV